MRSFTVLALAFSLALAVAACGKKGPLDKPARDKDDKDKTAFVLPR